MTTGEQVCEDQKGFFRDGSPYQNRSIFLKFRGGGRFPPFNEYFWVGVYLAFPCSQSEDIQRKNSFFWASPKLSVGPPPQNPGYSTSMFLAILQNQVPMMITMVEMIIMMVI